MSATRVPKGARERQVVMNHSTTDPSAALAAMAGSFLVFGLIGLVAIAFSIVIQWRIAAKAGYPGALSLLMLIPFVNFVILIMFAFSEWPIERALRGGGGTGTGFAPPPSSYVPPGGGGYVPQAMPYLPPTSTPPAIPPEA